MKLKTLTIVTVLTLGTIAGVAAIQSPQSSDATDSPLISEVDRQGKQLENHEARITNTESDVKDLQGSTGTAPSTNRVSVPSQPESSPEIPPQSPADPIRVISYIKIPVGADDVDCKIVYSDGSTLQWHWQTVELNQGDKIVRTSDICDENIIGRVKP